MAWLVSALAVIGIALLLVSQLERGNTGETPSAKATAGSQISLRSAGAFDPVSDGGDDKEHDNEVRNAIDGNANTDWTTEGYDNGVFASTKTGVGLYVKTSIPATAATATIRTPDNSMGVEIYGAKTLPSDLAGWTKLGAADGAINGESIKLKKQGEQRYYMVWITKLPPPIGGTSNAKISEFVLRR